jgi:chromosome segregation ATPase
MTAVTTHTKIDLEAQKPIQTKSKSCCTSCGRCFSKFLFLEVGAVGVFFTALGIADLVTKTTAEWLGWTIGGAGVSLIIVGGILFKWNPVSGVYEENKELKANKDALNSQVIGLTGQVTILQKEAVKSAETATRLEKLLNKTHTEAEAALSHLDVGTASLQDYQEKEKELISKLQKLNPHLEETLAGFKKTKKALDKTTDKIEVIAENAKTTAQKDIETMLQNKELLISLIERFGADIDLFRQYAQKIEEKENEIDQGRLKLEEAQKQFKDQVVKAEQIQTNETKTSAELKATIDKLTALVEKLENEKKKQEAAENAPPPRAKKKVVPESSGT